MLKALNTKQLITLLRLRTQDRIINDYRKGYCERMRDIERHNLAKWDKEINDCNARRWIIDKQRYSIQDELKLRYHLNNVKTS